MNVIGKFLVLVNVLLSVVMLTWALAIYLDPVDWGKKNAARAYIDPPKDKKDDKQPNELIPSEVDKARVALKQAVDSRPRAEIRLERAQRNRDQLRLIFADNHMKYVKLVDDLEKSPGPVEVRELKKDDATGTLVLSPMGMTVLKTNGEPDVDKDGKRLIDPNRPIGFPVFEDPLKDVNKSYQSYTEDLKKVMGDYFVTSEKITEWLKKEEKLTVRVTGDRDAMGKFITPGYYDLLELEGIAQRRLKHEIDYVQPLWVKELVSAQLLLERRRGLIKRLQELGDKNLAVGQ